MSHRDLPQLDGAVAALLDEARQPQPLGSERKQALWARVLHSTSATHGARPRPRRRRRWAVGAATAVAAAGLVALVSTAWVSPPGVEASHGVVEVDARTTVAIASRGTVVAEPGTQLRWRVDADGNTTVRHRGGRAFYRVEPGGDFVVQTPAGTITATGTSFEVIMKKQSIVSAIAGAAIAATVVVVVYEGNVIASNRHGSLEVAASQQATLSADESPGPVGPRDLETDRGLRNSVSANLQAPAVVAQLHDRVRQLESELRDARADTHTEPPNDGDSQDEPADSPLAEFFEPTAEQLDQAVKECAIGWAAPAPSAHGDPTGVTDARATDIGLSDTEREAINEAGRKSNAEIIRVVRELYIETTGDEAGAATMSYKAMVNEVADKAAGEDSVVARVQIARERAGQTTPPSDPADDGPLVRLYRAQVTNGVQFNQHLLSGLGPERAREIRGELSLAYAMMSGCEPD